ncbi:nucleotide exchange factor GrpE [Tsukamurella hominis]|uniref:nucleotide exchange factor GrpE n=1 Tax=Tsukamurella hominis TaxID=1970232 RepID=UPI0039E821FA
MGEAFDPAVMEAAEVVATEDEGEDRTVAEVLAPGLSVPARNVRPARVVVRAFRSA